jgi:hypothetical protein
LNASYHYALCRYKEAELTQWAQKSLQQADIIIKNTKNVVPDLGGEQTKAEFDKLERDVKARLQAP